MNTLTPTVTSEWLDDAILVDPETGEIIDTDETSIAQETATKELAANLDLMIDRYADGIRTLEANAKVCADERDRYGVRARIWSNKAKRAKEWLMLAMNIAGRQKVGTASTTATICGNGGKTPIDVFMPVEEIPDEYCVFVRKPNEIKIRAALEAGEKLPFATLMDRGSHLRLK